MTQSTDQDAGHPVFDPAVRDERRLEALRDYDILDTPPEDAFDRLTRIAADLFGVEVAFVAFLDTDRQWFKSSVGLDQTESTLAASFCTHTIEGDGPLVIEDAANDERTQDSPFVTEAGLRFYAGVPIRAPGGEAIGTFSIMTPEPQSLSDEEVQRLQDLSEMASDALERRRDARTHEEMARRFEAVLNDPDRLVGVLAPDGTLLKANETSLQYIEASEDEVLGQPFWETSWWPTAMRNEIRSWIERAVDGEYVEYETDLEQPGGEPYRVQGTIRPVVGADGTTEALLVSARDVTERKRREEELRRLSEAIEHAKEAVLITEADPLDEPGPRIVYANKAFEEQTGYSEEEVLGKTPRILQGPETEPDVLDEIRTALERGENWEGTTVNYQKDGTPYWVQWNLSPVRGEDGEIEHWVSVQRNVTEERQRKNKTDALYTATEQLLKAQSPSEVAERIKNVIRETFAYPLNGVHFARAGQLVPVEVSSSITERWSDPPARDLDGDGLGARAYRSGRTATAADLSTLDTTIDYKDLGSGACVPLGDHGVISIASTEVDDIDAFDVRLLEILAADAAAVLDRIEYEEKLERQNDLFAQAQNIAQVGGWEYNIRRDESSLTDQAYRIHGLSPDADMDPETSLGFFHPDDRPTIRDAFTRAIQEGIPYDLELRLLPEDGDQRWVRTNGEPLVENGEVYCIRGTLQDITERKNREEALRRSEKRWRSLLEHLRCGIHVSVEDTIRYVNPAGAEILGAEHPDDLVGRGSQEFVPDDVEVDVEQRLETLKRGEPTAPIEHEIVRLDGTRRLVQVYSVPLQVDGRPGRQSVFRDVTERKRREERLRDRRRKIESLYDATKGLLTAEHPAAIYEGIHDVITDVFDYSLSNTGFVDGDKLIPVEMSTDDPEGVPSPKVRAVEEDSVATRALRTGETVVVTDLQALDNRIDYGTLQSVAAIPIAGHGVIVLGQTGAQQFEPVNLRLLEVLGTYASMVLDRLHGEEALRAAKEEAEKASRLKSAMLANMSHEIRTPLTSITGFAELLTEHLEGRMQTFAEQIYNGGTRLQKTLDSVLQLSRLEAGIYEMGRTSLSLGSLIEDTVDMLRLSAEEKDLRLNVELPDGPVEGAFNEGAVNRILENLLENAIKFTPDGGTVEVRARRDGDDAVLEVEDTGVGINEEVLPEIFGAFKQESEGLAREYEGSGLGLSIVQRLAEAHGGTVEVDSEKGVGTRFTVRLPRSAPTDE